MKYLLSIFYSISMLIGHSQFTSIDIPPEFGLFSIEFLNEDTGMLLMENGRIYTTEDGGAAWDSIETGYLSWLNGAYYFNESDYYVYGGANFPFPPSYFSDLILRTSDQGLSFDSLLANFTGGEIIDADFADINNGIFLGTFNSFRTSDGGASIDTITDTLFTSSFGNKAVSFPDNQNAYVSYLSPFMQNVQILKVLHSSDQGETWSLLLQDTLPGFLGTIDMQFNDPLAGRIIFSGGNYFTTNDGGATWTSTVLNPGINFREITFVNDNVGFALGDLHTQQKTYLYRTLDAGLTWNDVLVDSNFIANDMDVEGNTLYISGYDRLLKYEFDSSLVSVNDLSRLDEELRVYPNPAVNEMIVEFPQEGCYTIDFCDLLGRQFYSSYKCGRSTKILLKDIPIGTYHVTLTSKDEATYHETILIE